MMAAENLLNYRIPFLGYLSNFQNAVFDNFVTFKVSYFDDGCRKLLLKRNDSCQCVIRTFVNISYLTFLG